jgi:type I restriction enzyme S subunit
MTNVRAIGDLIETLIDYRGKTPPKTKYGVPLITAKVIKGGRITSDHPEFIAAETYDSWMRRGLPQPGDILITTEAPLGEVAQIGTNARVALAQRVILFRPDTRKVDPQFLFHYLRSPEAQARIRRRASGTTVSGIRQPELRAVEISLLGRRDQEKVGRILDALDGLIENNRRRMELLEQTAQAIYREWFVHFRYPGHEDAPLVDSPLGQIPTGWEVLSASNLLTINPRVALEKASEHPFVTMGDVSERSMICFPSEMRSGSSGSKFQNGDTLLARITPCLENGKTAYVQSLAPSESGRGSTEFIVLRGRRVGPTFTYMLARVDAFRSNAIQSMTGASGRQRVRNECFDSYLVASPPKDLADTFEQVAEPMVAMAYSLARQNHDLAKLRDLLLPKLVTGQIDVSTLDLDALVDSVA